MRGLDEHKDRNENVAAKSIASDNAVFLLLFRILVNDGLHRDGCVDAYGEYLYQKDHGPEWFMEAVTITDTNNKSFQDLCAAFADIRDRELTEKFGRRDPDNHTDTTSLEPRHGLDPCR
jgi:hypothetical protein